MNKKLSGKPGALHSVFYLRNHNEFFELMCTPEPEPIDSNYSDFAVSPEMIERMEDQLLDDLEEAGLTLDVVPETLAYSGASAHPFRQHAPSYSGVSAHL